MFGSRLFETLEPCPIKNVLCQVLQDIGVVAIGADGVAVSAGADAGAGARVVCW